METFWGFGVLGSVDGWGDPKATGDQHPKQDTKFCDPPFPLQTPKPQKIQRRKQVTQQLPLSTTKSKLGALQKARLGKVRFSDVFLGFLDFLRSACSLDIPQESL